MMTLSVNPKRNENYFDLSYYPLNRMKATIKSYKLK